MRIVVEYFAQARSAAGAARETVEVDRGELASVLAVLAQRHGHGLARLVLDADRRPAAGVVFAIGDRQVSASADEVLRDGDVLTILPAVSGG